MDFENFGAAETAGLVLTGFVVVFLALILLVIIFWAFGRIMDNVSGAFYYLRSSRSSRL